MLKYLVFTALFLTLAYSLTAPTCADNPILPLLKTFIASHDAHMNNPNRKHKKAGEDGPFNGEAIIAAYESQSGTAVDDLSKCTNYNSGGSESKISCCSNDLVSLFPKLTKGFFRRRMGKPPKSQKLIRTVHRLAKRCGADMTGTDLKAKVKTVIDETRTCQKKALTADVNLLRGTLCSICVAPADFSTYFIEGATDNDLQIKVLQGNLNSYDTKMQEGLTCFDNQKSALETLVTEIVDAWDQTKCATEVTRIKQVLTDEASIGTKSCNGSAKPLKDEGCLNETEDDGTTHGDQRPASGSGEVPSEGGETPGEGGQTPSDGGETPGDGGETPVEGEGGEGAIGGGDLIAKPKTRGLLRILSSSGGYVADAEGLDGIYSVDSSENSSLNSEEFPVEEIDDSGFDGPADPAAPASGIIAKVGLGLLLVIALLF